MTKTGQHPGTPWRLSLRSSQLIQSFLSMATSPSQACPRRCGMIVKGQVLGVRELGAECPASLNTSCDLSGPRLSHVQLKDRAATCPSLPSGAVLRSNRSCTSQCCGDWKIKPLTHLRGHHHQLLQPPSRKSPCTQAHSFKQDALLADKAWVKFSLWREAVLFLKSSL